MRQAAAILAIIPILSLIPDEAAVAQTKRVTCDGILVEIDIVPGADFPMAVVYDTRTGERHTCVLDLGRAGHWPLRGACWPGERCILAGPISKKSATPTTCGRGIRPKRPITQKASRETGIGRSGLHVTSDRWRRGRGELHHPHRR
jgi:hypothetical protein